MSLNRLHVSSYKVMLQEVIPQKSRNYFSFYPIGSYYLRGEEEESAPAAMNLNF